MRPEPRDEDDGTIIDCHCHAGPGDGFHGPWDTDAPLGRYLRRATAAGIGRTVIFAALHLDYAKANRKVADIVASDPRRFIGFAFVHADRDRGRIGAMVRTAVERYGFRGIKAHRHDGRLSREICEAARDHDVPVLYDVVGDVASIDLFASQYPDVRFLIPHLGSFSDDYRAQQAIADPLTRYPNVFTDTSGVRRFDLLLNAVRRAGPRKVLFGSDGPWLHPGVELAKVRALNLRPDAFRAVTSQNLLRLCKIGEHSAPNEVLQMPQDHRFASIP